MSASLWPELDNDRAAEDGLVPASDFDRRLQTLRPAVVAPTEWEAWIRKLYPRAVTRPFAPHHRAFWAHVWGIEPESRPRPWLSIWPREGGKSTNLELACAALGVRGKRLYGVYVRRTQDRADDSVQNVAAKLAGPGVELHYPDHARPLVGKFGNRAAWRRNRLRTAGGFTLDAIGLDVAARGAKIEDDRPDFFVIDDIDEEHDTAGTTARKIITLTTAILPAGAENVAVFGAQNLIIPDGVFAQLVDGRGEFLTDRIVSGPHPAVKGLKWEWVIDPESETRVPKITAGTPTWAGQDLAKCERNMRLWGPRAFEREAQHDVFGKQLGVILEFDDAEHFEDLTAAEVLDLVKRGTVFGGIDYQWWRFGFVLRVADEYGVVHRVEEYFSQAEELSVRAQMIHDKVAALGLMYQEAGRSGGAWKLTKRVPIWGDSANPTDTAELNAAFRRIGSPLRVVGVGKEPKMLKAAIDRMNDALGRGAMKYVRAVGATDKWRLGMDATREGREMTGSRLLWEMRHWKWTAPQPGKVDLKGVPDDHSADGADLIAADRYALMSYWTNAPFPDESESFDAWSPETLAAEAERTWKVKSRRKQFRQSLRQEFDE